RGYRRRHLYPVRDRLPGARVAASWPPSQDVAAEHNELTSPPSRDMSVRFIRLCRNLSWWIRAWRLIGGSIVHRINHVARIHHANPEGSPGGRLSMRVVMLTRPGIHRLRDRALAVVGGSRDGGW